MSSKKTVAATRLLGACEAIYAGDLRPETDISSKGNTVATYASAENQKKYVHMFFARYVACWRAVRERLDGFDGTDIVSVGAGPLLCCMGWAWDEKEPPSQNQVFAYDIHDWRGVRDLPEFEALWRELYECPADYKAPRSMPDSLVPPQALKVPATRPITVAEIGSDRVMLLSFVLNHLVGDDQPVPADHRSKVFKWIELVRQAGNHVIIADMLHRDDTAGFWRRVTGGLGAPTGAKDLNLDFGALATETANAYANVGQRRRRAGLNDGARKAAVLFGSPDEGWSWLT